MSKRNKTNIRDFGKHSLTLHSLLENIEKDDKNLYDIKIINEIAKKLEKWALKNKANFYSYYFTTIFGDSFKEKQTSFLDFDKNKIIKKLSGKDLLRTETDGSSFPTQLRKTNEARSFLVLDESAIFFIYRKVLYIPCVFITPQQLSLDIQNPLIKSMSFLKSQIENLSELITKKHEPKLKKNKVKIELGWEMEFFLLNKNIENEDIKYTERCLTSKNILKSQAEIGNYFNKIDKNKKNFFNAVYNQSILLGIPLKCRHGEVAPSQYEYVYLFDDILKSAHHCFLFSFILKDIGDIYGYKVIFHEKPFDNMNGSGKHLNISVSLNNKNLFDLKNLDGEYKEIGLSLMSILIDSLNKRSDILMESIFNYSNEKRLGGHEAPPNIFSIFLGQNLHNALYDIKQKDINKKDIKQKDINKEGINKYIDERNRTSPFAYTGNRFEFRAVGSSIGSEKMVLTAFNTIFGLRIKEILDSKEKINYNQIIKRSERIIFEGNGYSKEWEEESKKRGLKKFTSAFDAIMVLKREETKKVYKKAGIFNEEEIENLFVQKSLKYLKAVKLDVKILKNMVYRKIIPSIEKYLIVLNKIKETYINSEMKQKKYKEIENIEKNINILYNHMELLEGSYKDIQSLSFENEIKVCAESFGLIFNKIIETLDILREAVPEEIWPLESLNTILEINK